MRFDKNKIISAVCIAVALGILYANYEIGLQRATAGKPALVWLYVLTFAAVIALVIASIVFSVKARR